MAQFSGKVALITGGASGIGLAIARMYAREGARVVISDIVEKDGQAAVEEVRRAGGEALFVRADITNPDDCQAMVSKTVESFGRLDFACNNAGIGGESNPTAEYSVEGWRKVIDINLLGVFYSMKYEIPAILESGGGSIINMASILGEVAFATSSAYVAAKHGVVGLTKTTAVEYAAQGIRVNAVGPGFIRTPMIAALEEQPEVLQQLVSLHPIGRLGEANEVAELVIWLSSDKASFVTGAYYPIDGGYLAR